MVNIIYENEKEIRKIMKWYNNDIPRIDFWVNIDKLITDVKVSRVELPVKPESGITLRGKKIDVEKLMKFIQENY